jgi:hypothetical protein
MATNNAINNSFSNLSALANGSRIIDNIGGTLLNLNTSGGTPVNSIQVVNGNTGIAPYFKAVGSDTNVSLQLQAQGTGSIALQGTGTNDSAAAGYVGEIISANNIATGVSLSTGATSNIVSISLTAGDWDVWGNLVFSPGGATTYTNFSGSITTSSGTISNPSISDSSISLSATFTAATTQYFALSPCRISIASTTTVYLTAQSTFGVSTLKGAAVLTARRAR